MKKYCDNSNCEAEAVETVSASVNKFDDSKRHYCAACYEAYCVGAQHARFREQQAMVVVCVEDGAVQTVFAPAWMRVRIADFDHLKQFTSGDCSSPNWLVAQIPEPLCEADDIILEHPSVNFHGEKEVA